MRRLWLAVMVACGSCYGQESWLQDAGLADLEVSNVYSEGVKLETTGGTVLAIVGASSSVRCVVAPGDYRIVDSGGQVGTNLSIVAGRSLLWIGGQGASGMVALYPVGVDEPGSRAARVEAFRNGFLGMAGFFVAGLAIRMLRLVSQGSMTGKEEI